MNSHSHASLIIVGHGSTVNPDSSAPTHQHADTIRRLGVFREVACCFWKEEPTMREIFEAVEGEVVRIGAQTVAWDAGRLVFGRPGR